MICCKCFVFGRNKWISFSSFHSFICDVNQTWVKCTLFTLYNSCLNCPSLRAGKLKLMWLRNNMLSTEIFTPRNKENAYGQNYTRGQKNNLSLKTPTHKPSEETRHRETEARSDSSRLFQVEMGQGRTTSDYTISLYLSIFFFSWGRKWFSPLTGVVGDLIAIRIQNFLSSPP